MLTVRELLTDLDVRLLAGEAGMDAPVRWVHISELLDPTPWLSGGELLLTTGLQLADPEGRGAFVGRLAEHGLAGLGVGTGFAFGEVPDELVEEAERRAFPLFEVPYELPFIALTEKAFTRLVNEQYDLLRRSIAAQERLQRVVLSERGLEAVAGALAALVGGAVLVFDARGEELARHLFRRRLDDDVVAGLAAEVRERASDAEPAGIVPRHAELAARALALPVAAGGTAAPTATPQAWLVAVKDGGALTDHDRLLLQQGVTAVALELLRRRVADSTERRLAGDVLSAVVAGDLQGTELRRRLEPFGLGGRVAALVAHPGEGLDAAGRVEAALSAALRDEAVAALVATHAGFVVALVPGLLEDELLALGRRVLTRVRTEVAPDVQLGAGRAQVAERARHAFHEARFAVEARRLAPANGHVRANGAAVPPLATWRDLGSFALLLALQESEALRQFCAALLGPLEEGEGHYGGELLRSLEAFIECNGQWEAAARRLYCHRHTLRYRIRKIEELTGRDLASARDRIEFWLALRGREIVT